MSESTRAVNLTFRAPKLKMEVLEKAQIEREFELVSARLKLTKRSRSSQSALSAVTGPGLSANETVSLLTASNLYEDAVHIGRIFELDHRPVLEGLASRCVWLAKSAGAVERDAAWDWLAENREAIQKHKNHLGHLGDFLGSFFGTFLMLAV